MATSATDSVSKKEDESARARSKWRWTDGHGRKSARKLEGGTREGEPTFHRGMERKELSGQNYQGREGGRENGRAGERHGRLTRWRRRSSGGAWPHFCLKLRKGTEKEGRKDVVKIYRAREGEGREGSPMANATKGREGKERGRHFPQKIKQISFLMGLDAGGGDNRASLAAWNKTP